MLLKKGDNNESVKLMQEKLGISPAVTNFGPKTEEAVKAFQLKNGLTPDGIVGDKTWGMIMGESVEVTPQPVVSTPSVSGLKLDKLKGHIPQSVIDSIPEVASKFEINTPLRVAHFLAQCGHESGGFKLTQENLNYSAKGLLGIFPKYFDAGTAAAYERKPEKIANVVYANRMGNGDKASGDGWKFHGRGFIQLTGHDNYKAFSTAINEDCVANQDLVATKYALASAAWFFHKNGLHKIADEGATDAVVTKVTKRVNGGTIGLEDRIKHFKEYHTLLA